VWQDIEDISLEEERFIRLFELKSKEVVVKVSHVFLLLRLHQCLFAKFRFMARKVFQYFSCGTQIKGLCFFILFLKSYIF